MRASILLLSAFPCFAGDLPRFENYPVKERWTSPAAPLKLNLPAERMFQTRLREGHLGQPQFAGTLRFAIWGCGSNCAAGAFIDLRTGAVYPPPTAIGETGWDRWIFCPSSHPGTGFEYRVDSRLLIARCGWNPDKHDRNHPETRYFLWESGRFRLLKHIPAPRLRRQPTTGTMAGVGSGSSTLRDYTGVWTRITFRDHPFARFRSRELKDIRPRWRMGKGPCWIMSTGSSEGGPTVRQICAAVLYAQNMDRGIL